MPKPLNCERFNEQAMGFYQAMLREKHPKMTAVRAKRLAAAIGDISEFHHDPEIAARIKYAVDHPTKEDRRRQRALERHLSKIAHLLVFTPDQKPES